MANNNTAIRPFLKWAGNKYRILHHIQEVLPDNKRLVEPFLGSGAVFLNTDFKQYLLCDSNRDLITLFSLVRDRGDAFIDDCRENFIDKNNQQKVYYQMRERFNHSRDEYERAMLFVYLNRHGYNGLCRYNKSGGFNVPFGRYKKPYFPQKELLAFHHKAQNAEFLHQDFQQTFRQLKKSDVVYCDPPYVPLTPSANFTSYSAGGFGQQQQEALAICARKAADKGINVIISNHDTEESRLYYQHANDFKEFHVQRYISRNGNKRDKAGELIASFL